MGLQPPFIKNHFRKEAATSSPLFKKFNSRAQGRGDFVAREGAPLPIQKEEFIMNLLNCNHLSNQIAYFKEHSSSFVFITRRNYSLAPELSIHHRTYHSFIDKSWPGLRKSYSENSDIMPDIIKTLKPSFLDMTDESFYYLYRQTLNGDLSLFNYISVDVFQEISARYSRIMQGKDFEDSFISAESFLRSSHSSYSFIDQYAYIVISDYHLLLENPAANANAIHFIQGLLHYASSRRVQVLTLVNQRFVPIESF